MANIRNLKKDINYVLGDIIEAVYIWEIASQKPNSKEGNAIIDKAIETFDSLIAKVNDNKVENRKTHLKNVRKELEDTAEKLVAKINKLG